LAAWLHPGIRKKLLDLSGGEMDAERGWVKQRWEQITGEEEKGGRRKAKGIDIHPVCGPFSAVVARLRCDIHLLFTEQAAKK